MQVSTIVVILTYESTTCMREHTVTPIARFTIILYINFHHGESHKRLTLSMDTKAGTIFMNFKMDLVRVHHGGRVEFSTKCKINSLTYCAPF